MLSAHKLSNTVVIPDKVPGEKVDFDTVLPSLSSQYHDRLDDCHKCAAPVDSKTRSISGSSTLTLRLRLMQQRPK